MSQQPTQLTEPRDGLPGLIADNVGLTDAAQRLHGGTGPVAIDAERASGYRYSQRAYLVQLRRAGTGTILIDPIPLGDLSPIARVLENVEWVLHAASQDLWCLAELGMMPAGLFDTELAARLLGYPRVGLAPLIEEVLGQRLEKGHSAADWSARPLPQSWLVYAALDVELLLELRDALGRELVEADKWQWAGQEFEAVRADGGRPKTRAEPWRRTSGMHNVRGRRALAVVRALWQARDELASSRDIAPGRVLPDAAIIDAARSRPSSVQDMVQRPIFRGRAQRREAGRWFRAIAHAENMADSDLPSQATPTGPTGALPPTRSWRTRAPEAAERLRVIRDTLAQISEETAVPTENLLSPDAMRRLAWQPPDPVQPASVAAFLHEQGARPWQRDLVSTRLSVALTAPASPP